MNLARLVRKSQAKGIFMVYLTGFPGQCSGPSREVRVSGRTEDLNREGAEARREALGSDALCRSASAVQLRWRVSSALLSNAEERRRGGESVGVSGPPMYGRGDGGQI